MIIKFNKTVIKQIANLKSAQRRRLHEVLRLFRNEPYHSTLHNHALVGKWAGHRSISFGGDWRAHYILKGEDIAFFVAVGTHDQLYS